MLNLVKIYIIYLFLDVGYLLRCQWYYWTMFILLTWLRYILYIFCLYVGYLLRFSRDCSAVLVSTSVSSNIYLLPCHWYSWTVFVYLIVFSLIPTKSRLLNREAIYLRCSTSTTSHLSSDSLWNVDRFMNMTF
jgi:hypothetical protein